MYNVHSRHTAEQLGHKEEAGGLISRELYVSFVSHEVQRCGGGFVESKDLFFSLLKVSSCILGSFEDVTFTHHWVLMVLGVVGVKEIISFFCSFYLCLYLYCRSALQDHVPELKVRSEMSQTCRFCVFIKPFSETPYCLSVLDIVLLGRVLLTIQNAVQISQLTQSTAITIGANVLVWDCQPINYAALVLVD